MIWLLIGYVFLIVYRPLEVWPALGVLRLELLYMIGVGAVWLAAPKRLSFSPLVMAIVGMVGAVVFCTFASQWAEVCLDAMDWWLKFQVFILMLLTVVRDETDLKRVSAAILVVMALYMLHSFWEFIGGRHVSRMGISRMVGVDSTNGDPNAFASTVLLSLVFVPPFWKTAVRPLVRQLLAGYVGLALLCICFTGSRAGFVGLGLFLLAVAWNSRHRACVMLALCMMAPIGFMALPDELQNRFETIVNPSVGPKNAKQSADGRIEGLLAGLELWRNNILTGAGPGAWKLATGRKLQPHNLVGQLAGEMGTTGMLALGGLLLAYVLAIRQIRRAYREHSEWGQDYLYHLTDALSIGLMLLLFGGIAGHNLFRPQWILFAALVSLIRQQISERVQASSASWYPTHDETEDWPTEGEPMPLAS